MKLEDLKKNKNDKRFYDNLITYIFDKESKEDHYYLLEGNLLLCEYFLKKNNVKDLDKSIDTILKTKINVKSYPDLYYRYNDILLEYYFIKEDIENIRLCIEIKKEISTLLNQFIINYDLFRLFYLLKDYNQAFHYALKVREEPLDVNNKITIFNYLYKYYLDNQDYDNAIISLNSLKMAYELLENDNSIFNTYILESNILVLQNKYQEALDILEDNLLEKYKTIKSELKIDFILLKLYLLTELNHYSKASILESEYEEYIEKNNYRVIDYYDYCISLYTKLNNRFSKEVFIGKKEAYKKKQKNKENEDIDLSKTVNNITLPELVKKEDKKEEIKTILKSKDKNDYYNTFFEYALLLSHELKYREFLRNMNIYFEMQYLKMNMTLVLTSSDFNYSNKRYDYHILHYKKERVYDKIKNEDEIKDTIIFEFKNSNRNVLYIENELELMNYKCIFSDKYYSEKNIKALYLLPFRSLDEKFGYVIFELFDLINDETKDMIDSYIHILTSHYYQKKVLNKILKEYQTKNIAFDKTKSLMKYEINNYIYFNEYTKKEFKIEVEKMDLLNYLSHFEFEDINLYKDKYYSLKGKNIDYFESKVKINNKSYLEINQSYYIDGNQYIISNYINIDEEIKENNKENEMLYYDNKFNIYNLYKLETDIKSFKNVESPKFSLFMVNLFNLDELTKFLGVEFKIQVFELLIKSSKEFNELFDVYLYNNDTLIIKINQNDTRTIKKMGEDLIKHYEKILDKKYEAYNFRVNIGYLRYPVSFNSLKIDRIYKYLNVSLLKANNQKLGNESNIEEFTKNDYNEIVFEEQIIKNINEAFLDNNYELKYNMIANYEKKTILGYYSTISIDNSTLNLNFIYDIFNKRRLNYLIDSFMVKNIYKNVKEIFNEYKKYIRVFVKIDINTIMNNNFFILLKNLNKEYNLYNGVINFIIINNENKFSKKEIKALEKLKNYKINLFVDDINLLFMLDCKGFIINNENLLNNNLKNKMFSNLLLENGIDCLVEKSDKLNNEVYENLNYNYFIDKSNKNSFNFEELKNKLSKKE